MFVLVEYYQAKWDGPKESYCLDHTVSWASIDGTRKQFEDKFKWDKHLSYEIFEFNNGEPCPKCGENFDFWSEEK